MWTDSLGLILAQQKPRPRRKTKTRTAATHDVSASSVNSSEEENRRTTNPACSNNNTNNSHDENNDDEKSCAANTVLAENTDTTQNKDTRSSVSSSYDDLQERWIGGYAMDYNQLRVAHECTMSFDQSTYETESTPYADLAWTRSYIGGGTVSGVNNKEEEETERETHVNEVDDDREQDTCLHLEGVLHSCLAFRPHVHETLIHYPASFLPKNSLKRVLFVGGGDLVILHEILRYDSVETVIGMELDQSVLRGSFRHYGIQPKFEDERVVRILVASVLPFFGS